MPYYAMPCYAAYAAMETRLQRKRDIRQMSFFSSSSFLSFLFLSYTVYVRKRGKSASKKESREDLTQGRQSENAEVVGDSSTHHLTRVSESR